MTYFSDDNICKNVFVFIVFITLCRFYILPLIHTLIDFICFDISILLISLIFCLSDFIDNCKSPVDIISKTNLSVDNNKVSQNIHQIEKALPFELTSETTFVEV